MELQAKQLKHNPKEFLMLIARIEIARRIMDKILFSLHLDMDLFVCTVDSGNSKLGFVTNFVY